MTELKEKEDGVVEYHEASSEFVEFAEVMSGITVPLAQAQETSAKEATKQAQILAGTTKVLIVGAYILATLIIGLAAYAMYQGNSSMAEKIVIALLAFLGGFGLGKGAKSS